MVDSAKSANLDPNLSQRLHRALAVGPDELFQLLEDPALEVQCAVLRNPALSDNHLLALLKRRDLSEHLLKAMARLEMFVQSRDLKLAMVRNPNTPGALMVSLLPQLYLFELVKLCYLPGISPDQKIAFERAIISRLPNTPLGNKLTLARRGTAAIAEALLRDGDPRLIEACLGSPQLKEGAVFKFLNSAAASAETISMVARHPRWQGRINLQLAILKNFKTPGIWFTLLLPRLSIADVKGLLLSQRLNPAQKKLVEEDLARRGLGVKGNPQRATTLR